MPANAERLAASRYYTPMLAAAHRSSLASLALALACNAQDDAPTQDQDTSTTVADADATSDADDSSGSTGEASTSTGDPEHTTEGSSSTGTPEEELPAPEVLWRTTVSGGFASAIVGTPDGGAVIVGTSDLLEGRAIAVRIADGGRKSWTRIYEPDEAHANFHDAAMAADGAVWLAGRRAWMSDLSPSRSAVLERIDDASGDVVWADPGLALEGFVAPSNDLFAVLALPDGGVIVAGADADDSGVLHPWLRRHADDGTIVWQGRTPDEGRAHDLVLVDDLVLAVGVRFESGAEHEPVAPWAVVFDLDGELVATPDLPPGRADLVLAVVHPDLGPVGLGGRYVEDGFSLDEEVGWLQPIALDGGVGESLPMPTRLAGAVALPTGEVVVAHGDDIEAYDVEGDLVWELEDELSLLDNDNDLLALGSDGTVLAVGGFEQMEVIAIAAPQR